MAGGIEAIAWDRARTGRQTVSRRIGSGDPNPRAQPLHRIFLPAISSLVTYFRPHEGHLNRNAEGPDEPLTPCCETGIVAMVPQPSQRYFCPVREGST